MAIEVNILKDTIKSAFDLEKGDFNDNGTVERISTAIANAVAVAIQKGINTAQVTHNLTVFDGNISGEISINNKISGNE